MKTSLHCIPCFIRQMLDTAGDLGLPEEMTSGLMYQTLAYLQRADWNLPPPVIARDIHRDIRTATGIEDPYLPIKKENTKTALELLPFISQQVASSSYPFMSAVKFSIAGNAIDLGAKSTRNIGVRDSVQDALARPADERTVRQLEQKISEAADVLFLADNAGEIVFDRPLLELIGSDKVTVAVRGVPVINDATLDDAQRSGLTERFRVISNGSDVPGTWLSDCCEAFVERFMKADLVIAKGQGNYESLCAESREIFFLFLTKCTSVSKKIGVATGTYMVKKKRAYTTG